MEQQNNLALSDLASRAKVEIVVRVYEEESRNIMRTAKRLKVDRSTVKRHLRIYREWCKNTPLCL